MSHANRIAICLIGLVLFAAPAHAALDPLLVEFGWSQPDPVTLPANYTMLVNSTPWDGHFGFHTVNAFPVMEFGDALAVDQWNHYCTFGSECAVEFSNGGQQMRTFGGRALDEILGGQNYLWSDGWDGYPTPFGSFQNPNFSGTWHVAAYVPQRFAPRTPTDFDPTTSIPAGLYGYIITGVEREVNASGQSIRLYGVGDPLPEPSTLCLFVYGLLFAYLKQRQTRGC